MSTLKTYDDFYRAVLELFPEAEMGEDLAGQLVVYTGMEVGKDYKTLQTHVYVDPWYRDTDEDKDQPNDD
jgi:hypothetical protein